MTTTIRGLHPSQIPDLITGALPKFLNKGDFVPIYDRQNWLVLDMMFEDRKRIDDGTSIEQRVVMDDNGSAQFVGLYEKTELNLTDSLFVCSAPWCFAEAKASYEARRMTMQRGASAITNYIKTETFGGLLSLAKLLDNSFTMMPANANDTDIPRGVPYWVNMLASGSPDYTGGFLGTTATWGDATTTTSIGGIDKAVNELWRNWAGTYDGEVNPSVVRTIRTALDDTGFTPPSDLQAYARSRKPKRVILSDRSRRLQFHDIMNAGPDDRNGDVYPFKSRGTLNLDGVEWKAVAMLEGETRSPIYILDLAHFFPFCHSDWWMKKSPPMNSNDRRHTYVMQWDCQFNWFCDNPRTQAVLATDS